MQPIILNMVICNHFLPNGFYENFVSLAAFDPKISEATDVKKALNQ